MLVILALFSLVPLSREASVRYRRSGGSLLDTILVFLVTALGQVFLAALLCGILGMLSGGVLVSVHLLVASGTVIVSRWGRLLRGWPMFFRGLVREAAGLWRGVRRFFRSDLSRVALAVFLVLIGIVSFYNVVLPVHDWDGFMYHLFLPAMWLQQGSLDIFPASPQLRMDSWVHFPGNVELYSAWYLALAGSDDLVEFAQFPLILAGLLALVGLVRLLGGGNRAASLALPLSLAIPIVLAQMNSSYVDVTVAAMFFLAFYLGLRAFSGGGWVPAVLAGVAGAVLLGSKASGPLFLGAVFPGLLLAGVGIRQIPWKKVLLYTVIIGGVAGLAGGYFFFRNWSATGNPLYPYQVKVGKKVLFKGIDPVKQTASKEQRSRMHFLRESYLGRHKQFAYTYYAHPFSGHGPLPLAAGIPSLVFIVLLLAFRLEWRRLLLVGGVILSVGTVLALLPTLFPRFTLIVDFLLVVMIAVAVSRLRMLRGVFLVMLGTGVVYGAVVSLPMNFHSTRHIKNMLKSVRSPSAADSPYSGSEFRRLDRILDGERVTVAYGSLIDPYILFGRRLSRRVVHVPAALGYAVWRKSLDREKVLVLVLGRPGYRYPEQSWVTLGGFRLVLSNRKFDVWLYRPDRNFLYWRGLLRRANFR